MHLTLIIPTKISQSYGLRFQDRRAASLELFEVTQACNRLIVYLDQARDIYLDSPAVKERADRLLEAVFVLRVKVYNLKKSWAQWDAQDRGRGNNNGYNRSNSGYRNSNYGGGQGSSRGYNNQGGGYRGQGNGYQGQYRQDNSHQGGQGQYRGDHDPNYGRNDGGGNRDAA
jgi:hypothetical protein